MEKYTLVNGMSIPKIGFGTYRLNGTSGANSITHALNNGYRLIDTAYNYENEGAVGKGIRDSKVDRSDVLVTSKLPGRYYHEHSIDTIQESLYRSQLEYFDIYLLHWPNPKDDHYVEAWQTLIQAQKFGLVHTIGVCNFLPEHIDRLEKETGVLPAINQIELHPLFNQKEQREYDENKGILTEAWSPLGRANSILQDNNLQKIADAHNKNIGQVILRWEIQLGVLPIPKSSSDKNQIANMNIFDFTLSDSEMATINSMSRSDGRTNNQDPAKYQEF
jgi:diketogulonate reductase-like aldo/keto reductase